MTQEERTAYVNRIYRLSIAAGLCRTNKDFAQLLGIDRSSVSSILKGNPRNLTESMLRRFRIFAKERGLEGEGTTEAAPADPPEQTLMRTLERMSQTILTQAQTIEALRRELEGLRDGGV